MKHRRRRAGFTMIELLISLMLATIIMGVLLSGYLQYRRIGETLRVTMDIQQNLRVASKFLARDLSMNGYGGFYMPPVISSDGGAIAFDNGTNDIAYSVQTVRNYPCLIRSVNGAAASENNVVAVGIDLLRVTNASSRLVRFVLRGRADNPEANYIDPVVRDSYRRMVITNQVYMRNGA